MSKASDILRIAAAEIGTKESPANSNRVKYNTAYYGRAVSGASYPWCVAFQWWVFKQAGASDLFYDGKKTASCSALMSYAKTHGQFVTSDFRPGDIALFQFDGDAPPDHAGLVEKVTGTTITTIDGNTSVTGSQDNGGSVRRRTRSLSLVLGAYRPKYDAVEEVAESEPTNDTAKDESAENGTPEPAMAMLPSLAGRYKVAASLLNLRSGAGTNKKVLALIPKGTTVTCYGYFTNVSGTRWLLVVSSSGVTGYCSAAYLRRT